MEAAVVAAPRLPGKVVGAVHLLLLAKVAEVALRVPLDAQGEAAPPVKVVKAVVVPLPRAGQAVDLPAETVGPGLVLRVKVEKAVLQPQVRAARDQVELARVVLAEPLAIRRRVRAVQRV